MAYHVMHVLTSELLSYERVGFRRTEPSSNDIWPDIPDFCIIKSFSICGSLLLNNPVNVCVAYIIESKY